MAQRILCVDDEPNIRLLFAQELGDEGYTVETAATGAEALGKIRAQAPDLLLLDIRMDDMSGLELLQMIRPDHPDLPVIMVTAVRGLRHDIAIEGDDRVVDYITKPMDLNDLRLKVRRALSE